MFYCLIGVVRGERVWGGEGGLGVIYLRGSVKVLFRNLGIEFLFKRQKTARKCCLE